MAIKCPKCQFENADTQRFCGGCGAQLTPVEEAQPSFTKTLEIPVEELTRGALFADRYEIIEELGTGGMGKVYRVEDMKIGEEIALKLIKPEISADKKTIERFKNELKTARKIRHKNICGMHDLGEFNGTHYITMEYVSGEDLKSLIRRVGRLDSETVIRIAGQVCEGLSEAHRLGVIHRDLKPSNIMIDKEGSARIMDFGIARSIKTKAITSAGVMIGTPEYMSPEQAEAKELDHRSDIYSLGVILYEMVTGRLPFEGGTPLSIAMKHKGEVPKEPKAFNPQISEDLNRLILRCMEKDKSKRFQSIKKLQEDLGSLEMGFPTTDKMHPERKPITSKEIIVTFGLKKIFIPALIVAAIVIAAIIIWRLLPTKKVVLAPKIENSIAVVSFENQTGDVSYNYLQKVIPNLILTNLENTGYFYVVTWERLYDLLKQIGKEDTEIIGGDLSFELCRMEGVENIILGTFTKAGDTFVTDVKVFDVETKELLQSAKSNGNGVDSILNTQIDELSREISMGLGIARQKIDEARLKVTDVTTNSLQAYRYYLNGKESYAKVYYPEAKDFFEKAIELDPTFSAAYFYLAYIYQFYNDRRARNEALEKGRAFSKNATEKERLFGDAWYALMMEDNSKKFFQILKQLEQKFPKEKDVYVALGYYYINYGEGIEERKKAKEYYDMAYELAPNDHRILNGFAYLYRVLKDYEKAIEYYKKYIAIQPEEANPLDSMGDVYFLMGRIDEALTKYKEAIKVKPDFLSSYTKIGYAYAFVENYSEALNWIDRYISVDPSPGITLEGYLWKGFYNYWLGRYEKALDDFQNVFNIAEQIENNLEIAMIYLRKFLVYYERGELELCQNCVENWAELYAGIFPEDITYREGSYNAYLAWIELKGKNIESAQKRLSKLESLFPNQTWYGLNSLKSEILLANGYADEAIAVFCEATLPTIPGRENTGSTIEYNFPFSKDILARAFMKKGEFDKAIAEYEKLTNFYPNSKDRRLVYPKHHYNLAKLYEQKGWIGKAIEHYEKFLDLWKDADSGIPEIEDAKNRLIYLKS